MYSKKLVQDGHPIYPSITQSSNYQTVIANVNTFINESISETPFGASLFSGVTTQVGCRETQVVGLWMSGTNGRTGENPFLLAEVGSDATSG